MSLFNHLRLNALTLRTEKRIISLARQVRKLAPKPSDAAPVLFFNASTRLNGVSQNAAFAFLAACGVQMAGVPVVHMACQAGLSRCHLGSVVTGVEQDPPCRRCVLQSRSLTSNAPTLWFDYQPDPTLEAQLADQPVAELSAFEYDGIPLAGLVLPSVRWVLRRHNLLDDAPTRFLLRAFLLSAHSLARQAARWLDEHKPRAVVVFNGVSYPEAVVRWLALQRSIPVTTHEVAHQPLTAFFSHQHVTAYPVDIPPDFRLSQAQNARLDEYLQKRFKGDFSMAGVRFWSELQDLDPALLEKISQFRALVPVFTNVIFDTSQIHANTLFADMFAWLEQVVEIIRAHPDVLFVVRAHPDELRPGKASVETVRDWVKAHGVDRLPNVVYIDAHQPLSSYALIQRAKFVMVYNSTIGLEAVMLGRPVLNGGSARYTPHNTVFLPGSASVHAAMARAFLAAPDLDAEIRETFAAQRENARRFQYYQLYKTPLPFDAFIEPHPTAGYVALKPLTPADLAPGSSPALQVVVEGILHGSAFLMP